MKHWSIVFSVAALVVAAGGIGALVLPCQHCDHDHTDTQAEAIPLPPAPPPPVPEVHELQAIAYIEGIGYDYDWTGLALHCDNPREATTGAWDCTVALDWGNQDSVRRIPHSFSCNAQGCWGAR